MASDCPRLSKEFCPCCEKLEHEQEAHNATCRALTEVKDENAMLERMVNELKFYVDHATSCQGRFSRNAKCDCGVFDILNSLRERK